MGYRASVQGTEERSVDSAHPSPAQGPHRSPYLRGVPRLRPDGDAETTAEGVGAGTDVPSRARKLAAIQMIDVELPTTDGRTVVLARHTEPENDHLLLLQRRKLDLPAQPPPKITAPPFRPAA